MFPQMGLSAPARAQDAEPDPNVYFTDDSGLLLTDGDGSLIVEG